VVGENALRLDRTGGGKAQHCRKDCLCDAHHELDFLVEWTGPAQKVPAQKVPAQKVKA
jgi:hypothetical protein